MNYMSDLLALLTANLFLLPALPTKKLFRRIYHMSYNILFLLHL